MKIELYSSAHVSEHFTWGEVLTSSHPNLQVTPSAAQLRNIFAMANAMEQVRVILRRPIYVTSWFRSSAVNAMVGGVKTSAHLAGLAVDFLCTREDAFNLRYNLPFDQLIWYEKQSFCHIGLRFLDDFCRRESFRLQFLEK